MDRLQNGTQAGSPPTPVSTGAPGFPALNSVWDPYTAHELIEEIRNAIVAGGIAPDVTALNQLELAIQALSAGSADAALLSLVQHEVTIDAPGAYAMAIPANAIPWAWGSATGAGGGAAGTTAGNKNGGGGGAGGTACGPIHILPGGVVTGVIGAPGAGGAAAGDGVAGGNTTMISGGSTFTGNGGGGGFNASNAGGGGGAATGGASNTPGGMGVDGTNTAVTGLGAPWACGGASFWGGGGRAAAGGGLAGQAPGSGGGAAYNGTGSGGAGAPGRAVLRYWTLN